MRLLLVLALATAGCNAIFGLEPTHLGARDAATADAADADAATLDATPAPDGPRCTFDTDCGTPIPGDCTMPVCDAGSCTIGPAPRDTFCNGFQDQCDGAGNCVDCTTSGGCGECCVCLAEVCQPA